MRILQATSWLSWQGGGVPPVMKGLARAQKASGHEVHVVGLDGAEARAEAEAWGVPVHWGRPHRPRALGFSSELRRFFAGSRGRYDVVHYHSLWMWPGFQARKFAQAEGLPLIVAPHGMVEPWALQRARLKKRVAAFLFENVNLRSSACLHALCRAEYENLRALGLHNPVAIVPNGIELSEYAELPPAEALAERWPELRGRPTALFLSRIHPKKGLPHLLRAWAAIGAEYGDWTLLVVGADQVGHTAAMTRLATDLGLAERVRFVGPLYGKDKLVAMSGAEFFVLPSFSEGFSMAVLEAATCGLPILLTPPCNFPEMRAAGGAIEIEPTEADTARGLREMMGRTKAERAAMGQKARRLVETQYTWPKIAQDMVGVYRWALGQDPRPDTVKLN